MVFDLDHGASIKAAGATDLEMTAAETALPPGRCAQCGTSAPTGGQLLRCGRCKAESYCNQACQRARWKSGHKKLCHADAKWRGAIALRDARYILVAAAGSSDHGVLAEHLKAVHASYGPDLTLHPQTAVHDERMVLVWLTMAMGVAALLPHIAQPPDGVFRLHVIGARFTNEGVVYYDAVAITLATLVLCGRVAFSEIEVTLQGPEMADLPIDIVAQHRESEERMLAANMGFKLTVKVSGTMYHDQPPPPASVALILNGGIDSEFYQWAPTLQLLLERGTPTALTGYTTKHGCDDAQGCERILRLMGGNVVLPSSPNPFRYRRLAAYPDGFIVGVKGRDGPPLDATAIAEVQRLDRIDKLEELAAVNEMDNPMMPFCPIRLRRLRSALVAREVHVPPEVNTSELEKWSHGQSRPVWGAPYE
eukprot:m.31026 g.31026  ORF g.31026 m.31026 type:complete len:422 (-) comp4764_c0_seq1:89-1354(-)